MGWEHAREVNMVPVMVRGVRYESLTECAKALGVKVQTVSSALDRGTIDNVGLGPGSMSGIPVQLEEFIFSSYTEASRALGMSDTYVYLVLKRGGDKAKSNLKKLIAEYRERVNNDKT